MNIAKELLDILVCPETKQSVAPAPVEVLNRLNQRILAGEVKNRAGQAVTIPLEGGLLRNDGRVMYPVREDIPIMLVEEGLVLDS